MFGVRLAGLLNESLGLQFIQDSRLVFKSQALLFGSDAINVE